MSKGNSMERARMMKALGARVDLVDQAPDSIKGQVSGRDLELVEDRTNELVKELNAFRADQFVNMANAKAHKEGTGPEIWNQSSGIVTSFCDFVGTGGSFGGCASFLKPKGVKCYVIEPSGAAILQRKSVTRPSHRIQGGGYAMKDLPCIFPNDVDGYLEITDEEAIQAARTLAKLEGIFGGFSAGANVAAAVKVLQRNKDEVVAILICDSGLKYLSTDLWE
jgi:cysteine synthase A